MSGALIEKSTVSSPGYGGSCRQSLGAGRRFCNVVIHWGTFPGSCGKTQSVRD